MSFYKTSLLLLFLGVMTLTGCAQLGDYEELPPLAPSPSKIEQSTQVEMDEPIMTETPKNTLQSPVEATLAPLQNAIADPSVSQAMDDLAQRLGITADKISLVSVLRMEFTLQAFYCRAVKERTSRDAPPEIMEGQVILLAAAGKQYEYHANDNEVFFCRQQNKLRP